MEDTTMRKMMVAVLFTAACGATTPPKNGNNGSGSDAGSGSGSSVPGTCTTAADCAAGMACDVNEHMCVTAGFTIDKTGFVDDGTRWWTSKSNPTLHGTIDSPSGETISVLVNNAPVGTATITGTTWSIDLPAGTIGETDTAVVIRLSSGVEQRQLFALDDKAPVAVMFGSIKDERGDTVDFSTGEAVHTHAGAAINLDGTGCPSVYKYAYLMDATKPLYGSETSPNPLTWQVKASDSTPIDNMDSAYRVRDASGSVLYNWTSMQPDASGVFAITLHRNDIAALGTKTGHMFVDVRFRDSFGNESTTSACWDNHPMAAPIEIKPVAPSTVFGWSLPSDSPISTLSIYTPGATVFSQRVVQYADEPVALKLSGAGGAISYSRTAVDHFVATGAGTGYTCPNSSSPCGGGTAPANGPDDVVTNATLPGTDTFWYATVIDEATGATVVSETNASNVALTLPARASGQPHAYRIDFNLGVLNWHFAPPRPSAGSSIGEFTVNNATYTGWNPTTKSVCTASRCFTGTTGVTTCACTQVANYAEIHALESLQVNFGAYTEGWSAGIPNVSYEAVSYADAATRVSAMSWNAGVDNLPQ